MAMNMHVCGMRTRTVLRMLRSECMSGSMPML